MREELKKEFQNRIAFADKKELLLIHYDMILEELELADKSLVENKEGQMRNHMDLVFEMLKRMVEALDFQYEVSFSLLKLYQKINKDLIIGKSTLDRGMFKQARLLLEDLRQIFQDIESEESEPLIQNSEVVYAGLTYGKNNRLTESVDFKKRGFKA